MCPDDSGEIAPGGLSGRDSGTPGGVQVYFGHMTEADFQTRFGRWIVSADARGIVSGGAAFELKLVKMSGNGSSGKKVGIRASTSGAGRTGKMPGLAFSRVEDHQVEALRRARGTSLMVVQGFGDRKGVKGRGKGSRDRGASDEPTEGLALYHKISDMALGFKPCDCIVIARGGGWLVVQYYRPGCRDFYMVDVEEYVDLRAERGGRGSLTEEDCRRVGVMYTFPSES